MARIVTESLKLSFSELVKDTVDEASPILGPEIILELSNWIEDIEKKYGVIIEVSLQQ